MKRGKKKEQKNKVKKGFNFYLYYWAILALVVFFLINYFTQNYTIEGLNLSLMISAVTFLFGFLVTISFSMLRSRAHQIGECLAEETGTLVSLFLLSKHLGKKFHNRIKKRIDSYTIDTLTNLHEYEKGRDDLYGIYDDLNHIEVKSDKQSGMCESFCDTLSEFSNVREKIEFLTEKRLLKAVKIANYTLGIILIVLLFLNRGDTFTNSLFIVLSSVVVFILLIIEDYDNLKIGEYNISTSNSEQIFDLIGHIRYYPEKVLKEVKLEKGKPYRIGFYNKRTKKWQVQETEI